MTFIPIPVSRFVSARRQIQTGVEDKRAAAEPPHSIIPRIDVRAVWRPRLRFYELYILILQKDNSIDSCVWGSVVLLQDPVVMATFVS